MLELGQKLANGTGVSLWVASISFIMQYMSIIRENDVNLRTDDEGGSGNKEIGSLANDGGAGGDVYLFIPLMINRIEIRGSRLMSFESVLGH